MSTKTRILGRNKKQTVIAGTAAFIFLWVIIPPPITGWWWHGRVECLCNSENLHEFLDGVVCLCTTEHGDYRTINGSYKKTGWKSYEWTQTDSQGNANVVQLNPGWITLRFAGPDSAANGAFLDGMRELRWWRVNRILKESRANARPENLAPENQERPVDR